MSNKHLVYAKWLKDEEIAEAYFSEEFQNMHPLTRMDALADIISDLSAAYDHAREEFRGERRHDGIKP